MPSHYETFFNKEIFAVVGHSAMKKFPKISFQKLKQQGKTVFPIDTSTASIQGDPTFKDFTTLPQKPEAVILEVPRAETLNWLQKAYEAGVKDIWIHMQTETPEALKYAENKDLNVRTGTCAVMYLIPHFSFHSVHKWINKLIGKY